LCETSNEGICLIQTKPGLRSPSKIKQMEKANEIKISYSQKSNTKNLLKITSSTEANQIIQNSWDKDNIELFETFKVIYLNNSNVVKGISTISTGGITGTIIDIRMIFATALKTLSTAIILTHNHPSGTLRPSDADKRMTEKIIKAGELLDIKILDHLIVTPNKDYYSFADNGLM